MRLSSIFLDTDNLDSQLVRSFVGERTFSELSNNFNSQGGGLVGFLLDSSKKFGGFLLAGINFIGWSIGGIMQWAIEKTVEVAYFDWKITDQEIANSIAQSNKLIGDQFGQLVGEGLVWLASIGLAKGLTYKFPVMSARLGLTLAEEGGDAIKGAFFSALQVSSEESLNMLALAIYGYSRNALFKNNGQKKEANKTLKKVFDQGKAIYKTLPFKNLISGFLQGFKDGVLDGLLDVAYTISFTIDDHYNAIRTATSSLEEPTRTIEIYPDGEDSEESITVTGSQTQVIEQTNDYLSSHQLVRNRDMGVIIGQDYDEWYGLKPRSRNIIIEFREKPKPPFPDENGKTFRCQVAIPEAKRGINWNDLKAIKSYTWGNSWATVTFRNRRYLKVWGASEKEAQKTALELSRLVASEVIQTSTGTIETQNPRKRKRPKKVYPCFATLTVRKTVDDPNNSTTIDGQNRAMSKNRYQIWKDEKPEDFKPLK